MNSARLATLVRIRRLQEQIARGEVMRDRKISTEREEVEAATVALVGSASQAVPATAATFVAHRRMLEQGVRDIDTAGAAVSEAHRAVAGSLAGWTAAAQRLDGVERLEEREATAAQTEQDRLDGAELDDLIVMRWKGN